MTTALSPHSSPSFLFHFPRAHPDLHSFPTRRSSDLREIDTPEGHTLSVPQRRVELSNGSHFDLYDTSGPYTDDRAHIDVHARSEEHTSELQSRGHLVCRLLLEKKKDERQAHPAHTRA